MPFVSRVTSTPPLNVITEIEQIIIVDQTGPAVSVGVSPGAVCLVGEFLKGPFDPAEVFTSGEIFGNYGGMSRLLSQNAVDATTRVQDGSGVFFDGNGIAALLGKTFRRLVLQRTDNDMTTTDGGTTKALVEFTVDIDVSDQDADTPTITGRDILIPAGTRFGNAVLSTATKIVALSQDITIPKGTTITAGKVTVDETFTNGNGTLGATAFFVKGVDATTAGTDLIDTAIDTAIPGSLSTIDVTPTSTITPAGAATDVFAAGVGATLALRNASRYATAIDKTMPTKAPMEDITHIWSARNTSTIRAALWTNAKNASGQARGRSAHVAADPATAATSAAATTAKTNAKALAGAEFPGEDGDRVTVNFPHVKVFSADLNQNILMAPDGFKAMMSNQLPEEYQTSVQSGLMQTIQGVEDAFEANPLVKADYISFKANSLSAIRRDRSQGWQFQSAVTAVDPDAYPTRVKDNRRRFADLVQDTLVQLAGPYQKFPGTTERLDALVGAIETFCTTLLSPNNPSLQRIEGFRVDPKSANTPALTGIGIYIIIVKVRMLGDLDYMVFQTQIGPTVDLDA